MDKINQLTDTWGDARTTAYTLAITARKAMAYLRQGRFDYQSMIMPQHVDDVPPPDINVYPDGGLTSPANQHFGLAAAGIYVPNRFTDKSKACRAACSGNLFPGTDGGVANGTSADEEGRGTLLPQEAQFEHAYRKRGDRCILLPVPGAINSSTRSEAHGLFVAICTDGAVHIGIDNKAVVDRAKQLILLADHLCNLRNIETATASRLGLAFEIARRLRKPERLHWGMQRDGDIWAAIW